MILTCLIPGQTQRDAYSYSIDDYYFLTVTCDFAHLLNLPLHTKIMTQFWFTYIDSFRHRNQEDILYLKRNRKPWSKKSIGEPYCAIYFRFCQSLFSLKVSICTCKVGNSLDILWLIPRYDVKIGTRSSHKS